MRPLFVTAGGNGARVLFEHEQYTVCRLAGGAKLIPTFKPPSETCVHPLALRSLCVTRCRWQAFASYGHKETATFELLGDTQGLPREKNGLVIWCEFLFLHATARARI